jgi:REP element-mobilizing transposase RayT
VVQSITFRLAESVPRAVREQWHDEVRLLSRSRADAEERMRIEDYLNRGLGPVWLRDPQIPALVQDALLHFDGGRYRLHAWVIMPNHVHVVMTPQPDWSISKIVFAWKSFTANRANVVLGRRGAFWHSDYFDRFIRNDEHFATAVQYVEQNPVVAGLCNRAEEWRFSSARYRTAENELARENGAGWKPAVPGGRA